MSYRVPREEFERIVEEGLVRLPERFKRHFKNITILVEDLPDVETAARTGVPKDELLGLYTGVPLPERGGFFDIPPALPDTIILFQRNIEAISADRSELAYEIRTTLIHEVGHYFGLSEDELRQYE